MEQLLNFRKKLLVLLTNNSLGNIKSKYKRHSLITSMFTVLTIFIKKRVTAKSTDLVSALFIIILHLFLYFLNVCVVFCIFLFVIQLLGCHTSINLCYVYRYGHTGTNGRFGVSVRVWGGEGVRRVVGVRVLGEDRLHNARRTLHGDVEE